jgi:hypothetical protein
VKNKPIQTNKDQCQVFWNNLVLNSSNDEAVTSIKLYKHKSSSKSKKQSNKGVLNRPKGQLESDSQISDRDVLRRWILAIRALPKYAKYYQNSPRKTQNDNYYKVLSSTHSKVNKSSKMAKDKQTSSSKKPVKKKTVTKRYSSQEEVLIDTLDREVDPTITLTGTKSGKPQKQLTKVTELLDKNEDCIISDVENTNDDDTIIDVNNEDDIISQTDNGSDLENSKTDMSDEAESSDEESDEESDATDTDREDDTDSENEDVSLFTKEYAKRSMQTLVNLVQNSNDNDGWTEVQDVKHNKYKQAVREVYSRQFAPRNLPEHDGSKKEIRPTKLVLPVTFQIKPPKKGKFRYKNSRALLAILQALQLVSHDIYLGPLKADTDTKLLVNPDDVPDNESELKHYTMTPFISQTRVFSTKLMIHSNVDLKTIKTNPDFLQYIGEEGIKIDYN